MVNLLTKAGLKTGLLDEPVLDRDILMDRARRIAGSDDFGDPWFVGPLDKLLESLRGEALLHDAGSLVAMKQIEKVLVDRLWAEQWFAAHPEIEARPLRNPVVIVGPMRTGTTRLHRLLSADERFTHMRSFETISPVPRPGFEPGSHDPRVDLAKRIRTVANLSNPRTLSIHPTGPMEPEEELGLLVNSFWGMKHEAQWYVPTYGRWCEQEDAAPAYRQMARLLQLVGWSQQASSLKPWVLKTPQHMMDLPALLTVFPQARFIFTHRDPVQVVASSASLAWNQTCIYSDHADPAKVGKEWLRKVSVQVERMREGRELVPADRRIDVHFEDVDADWRAAMRRIYDFLDLDIERAWPAMETYVARAAALKRKPHRYSLAEFGLTQRQVTSELADYIAAYGVSRERNAATG
ncbi:sulfotransferase [Aurantiacibacter spongiae]|uniref:Sulfotransferase n=2 Tax=Aurantiacibacter spongiae TaxID=2488860 RepID=A0A3N5DM84_9SPHN|nr:sulfotransferase [Aurantiacibacter spongiae]